MGYLRWIWLLFPLACQQVITRPNPQFAVYGDSPLSPPAPLPETTPVLSPGEQWIPGHWVATDAGWQWVAGIVMPCP
ncbi:MAG: hypothetical protein ACOYKZ_04145 [Chlamydiia bacterium]